MIKIPNPEWMESVAEAGGWEQHAKQKAQKEFVERLEKIKKNQWEGINENLTLLKGFVDKNAGNILSQLKNDITETISLKFGQILAPLKNEIYSMLNDTINEALGPVMPYINEGIKWLGVGLDFVVDALFDVGVWIGTSLQEMYYWLNPEESPEAKAAEAERLAKARRARYQIGNVPGFSSGAGRGGFQAGSMGSAPSPPESTSTTSKYQE